MKNKFPAKRQSIVWNDIRSGHKPEGNRMLYILAGGDVTIGGYERYEGDSYFWDGSREEPILDEVITAWAYLNVPDFEE